MLRQLAPKQSRVAPSATALLPRYPTPGGDHLCGTEGLRNVITQAGVRSPFTQEPFSEAMLFGLGGGASFIP